MPSQLEAPSQGPPTPKSDFEGQDHEILFIKEGFMAELPWIVHALAASIPVALTIAFYNGTLFSLHVMAMSTTFLLLLPEGLILAVKAIKHKNRPRLIRLHVYLQFFSLSLMMVGLGAQFWYRQMQGKRHFKDFHSKLGVATILSTQGVAFVGVVLYYIIPKPKRVKYPGVLMFHRLGGRVAFVLGIFTILEALKIFNPEHKRHKGWLTYVVASAIVAQAVGMHSVLWPTTVKISKREIVPRSPIFKAPTNRNPLLVVVDHQTEIQEEDREFMNKGK